MRLETTAASPAPKDAPDGPSGDARAAKAARRTSPMPEAGGSTDASLWRHLTQAADATAFAAAWLALQCRMVEGSRRGLVTLGQPDRGPFHLAAHWPADDADAEGLLATANLAVEQRRGVVNGFDARAAPAPCRFGYPFIVDGRLHGAVAIELARPTEADLRRIMRQIQWGSAWIELMLRKTQARESTVDALDRTTTALGIIATAVEEKRFRAACSAVVTDLAMRFDCDRVSIGCTRHDRTRIIALSNSAHFGKRMSLVRALAEAMDEAIDQRTVVLLPDHADSHIVVTAAHEELAIASRARAICTVPLTAQDPPLGALTFERPAGHAFDAATVELLETVAAVVGPILDEKRANDRWLIVKAADLVTSHLVRLFGPSHFGRKAAALTLAGVVAFLALATGDYRVTAPARLEGMVRRVIAAPIDGYVHAERARAGDVVAEGDVLATLDDRDLVLERRGWTTVKQQRLREFDRALAQGNRADLSIIRAQIEQADAQIALLDAQLSRTELKAPFAGLVASGDLSQSVGAAVRRGEVLFEITPLDQYRVILDVDERDIRDLRSGQSGSLVLSAMPSTPLAFRVERITPVAEAKDGRNVFIVEGDLDAASPSIRPGMEGVAKVSVDRRRLVWIWTHRLVDFARLQAWRWWP